MFMSVMDVDMPAVGQHLALMVQTVQMPVEVPQVQFWDKDVDMLAVVPDRSLVSACRKQWRSRCCSSSSRLWTRPLMCNVSC